ncbi:hypothetical protein M407DRAFT_33678 [Tulasnella calospora MUT 4182]|uniref:Retrotransposon gag domain-containing protein n=1 Tax=Tulasnella calospora MUT 4182 TaxID=1051891 RepID=A0A0C3Q1W6_9AGAM|nr:hypothetical protein M407DRAFT_33678 [Tulasnella calospora MUT 4182]
MADFAAICMADDALAWWSALDEEVQGSWKLLREAMLTTYRPMFYGGSGEEAEKFIRGVRDKAINEGKREDNKWVVAYAESCLAGEALRWYTYLDSDTQDNWKKLQQALLIQYPRGDTVAPALNLVPTPAAAAPLVPAPKTTFRGRIRISSSICSTPHYVAKGLERNGRISSTSVLKDALEFEWNKGFDAPQTLSIPRSQIPGYDLLGVKWLYENPLKLNKSVPPVVFKTCPLSRLQLFRTLRCELAEQFNLT